MGFESSLGNMLKALILFQNVDIWPIIIRVDYSPCRVDLPALGSGKYVELVNLVPWKVFLFYWKLNYII